MKTGIVFGIVSVSFVLSSLSSAYSDDTKTQRADNASDTVKKELSLGDQLEGLAPDAAIAYLRYLLKKSGDDADVYFHLGVAYQEKADYDSALVNYKKALKLDPNMSKAMVNMGVVYDDKRQLANALNMFEQATKLNPTDVLAHSHAAFIWFELKNYKKAWEHLYQSLKLAPSDPQPHYYLAIFFWESGIYRESMREWRKVVELDREGSLAKEAKKNIAMIESVMSGANRAR